MHYMKTSDEIIFISWFEVGWVFYDSLENHFLSWHCGAEIRKGSLLWYLSFVATIWLLWLERNARIFNNRNRSFLELVSLGPKACAMWKSA